MKKKKTFVIAILLLVMAAPLFTSCGILSSDTVGGAARDSYHYLYGN